MSQGHGVVMESLVERQEEWVRQGTHITAMFGRLQSGEEVSPSLGERLERIDVAIQVSDIKKTAV